MSNNYNKYYKDSPVLIPDTNVKFFDMMRNKFNNGKTSFETSAKLGGKEFKPGYKLGVEGSINNFKVETKK